jgi:hypothetical protein
LSAVRQFAVYLAGSGLPVGVPGTRQGPGGSRRATPYLFTNTDVRAVMRAAADTAGVFYVVVELYGRGKPTDAVTVNGD